MHEKLLIVFLNIYYLFETWTNNDLALLKSYITNQTNNLNFYFLIIEIIEKFPYAVDFLSLYISKCKLLSHQLLYAMLNMFEVSSYLRFKLDKSTLKRRRFFNQYEYVFPDYKSSSLNTYLHVKQHIMLEKTWAICRTKVFYFALKRCLPILFCFYHGMSKVK